MRKTRRAAASCLALLLGPWSTASAASTVSIYAQYDRGTHADLYVQNSLSIPLGAVTILVENATGFALNTSLPGVSAPDSVYVSRPLDGVDWDALIVNNTALGVTLVPAGATAFLGTLSVAFPPTLLPGETIYPPTGDVAFLASIYDVNGAPINGPIERVRLGDCGSPYACGFYLTVPELDPSAVVALVALALAVQLRGGKMRRKSGSVGAPT